MTGFFLESPFRLAAIWIALQFGLIALWSFLRTRPARNAVWAGFVLGPALLLLSFAVETPGEQLIRLCRELATAVDHADIPSIRSRLSTDFHSEGLDRDTFLARLEPVLSRTPIDHPRLSRFNVHLASNHNGTVEFTTAARVRTDGPYFDWLMSRWRLTFAREQRLWLVTELKPIPTPPLYIQNLKRLLEGGA